MTDDFKLVQEAVKDAQGIIAETGRQVTTQARQMADILETCAAGWQGAGAAGFKTAQKLLNEDHDAIRRLLDVLHNAVGQTRNLTSENDIEVLQTFQNAAKSALNGV
ncbi:hypothetical protein BJP40_07045 [Streptomyces sp. CC53]|uniref:WXG100 family type VII secretion target n=1 Tax=unclassified Streptomyces TaxID=2593676 RepID=UPI0008DCDEC0|nr:MULTISPECIES: WXG100 family type VII secretion target [unclassified Streptomyces]OII61104.1 hypothetical protein BJP40_07045 [Streptomyces sp. CC53]